MYHLLFAGLVMIDSTRECLLARHGRMPQPVLTCAFLVVQLVTSVDSEFDGGI
jgi:hypothetical protein